MQIKYDDDDDDEGAGKFGRASYIVSNVGIAVTVVIVAICLGVVYSIYSNYNGKCYNYSKSNIISSRCWQWPASTTTTAKHATTIEQKKARHRGLEAYRTSTIVKPRLAQSCNYTVSGKK